MNQKIKCFFGRHTEVCVQEVILDEAVIEHVHSCFDCKWKHKFPTKPVPLELKETLDQLIILGKPKPKTPRPKEGWVN